MDLERIKPSGELVEPIIEGLFGGITRELAAVNLPNEGTVLGLAAGSVVETSAS